MIVSSKKDSSSVSSVDCLPLFLILLFLVLAYSLSAPETGLLD